MEVKGYLYMACAIGAAVTGMTSARRGGVAGPGTLLMLMLPVVGLIVLSSLDLWAFLRGRQSDERRRPAKRRRKRWPSDRDDEVRE